VSQLSRAGSLFADGIAASNGRRIALLDDHMTKYRIGCFLAATLGAVVSFGGGRRINDKNYSRFGVSSSNNGKPILGIESRSLATSVNAVLTTVFLVFVVLLFRTGRSAADWTRCFPDAAGPWKQSICPILRATPIMLQLLVYGEILPNVCHMLDYDERNIRTSVVIGSFIPLLLLTGWAAFGVALLPTSGTAAAVSTDPVKILLQGGGAIQRRLLTLSISAIGTTILGSYLALESAYKDIVVMISSWWVKVASKEDPEASTESFWYQPWISGTCIILPPLVISTISPSIFLQAIDFAGSYPVLLLYGVIPPVMALLMSRGNPRKSYKTLYLLLGSLSGAMIGASFISDLRSAINLILSRILHCAF